MTFEQSLNYGQAGESDVAMWLRHWGLTVLPVYEKSSGDFKGPQLFMPDASLVAPDLFVFDSEMVLWIEVKRKTGFCWHRITNRWTTGIDLRHYADYCRIDEESPWRVELLFLHEGGMTKDSPEPSPSGLYGGELRALRDHENHRHANGGTAGMVYWAREEDGGALIKLATLDEVRACSLESQKATI